MVSYKIHFVSLASFMLFIFYNDVPGLSNLDGKGLLFFHYFPIDFSVDIPLTQ